MRIRIVNVLLVIACNMFPTTDEYEKKDNVCTYSTSHQSVSAYCRHRDFQNVPQDLNPKIQELTFVNVTFKQINENSFIAYKNLSIIRIIRVAFKNKTLPIHEKTFEKLTALHTLVMDNIFTEFDPSLKYPENLKNLSLNDNDYITEIDLRSAASLTEFNVHGCGLQSFPKFNPSSPITTLDIRWNPMDNWTAEDLAPFCWLKRIYVEWDEKSGLTEPDRYCQCVRLENWINITAIITSRALNCTPPAKTEKRVPCNMEYSEDMLNLYAQCTGQFDPPTNDRFLTTLLIATLCAFIYRSMKLTETQAKPEIRRKRRPKRAAVKEKGKRRRTEPTRRPTTKAPEKTERGGDADIESEKEASVKEEQEFEEYYFEEEEMEPEQDETGSNYVNPNGE